MFYVDSLFLTTAEQKFVFLILIISPLTLRPQYFKIIEECVSQIVLHRSGTDPDFSYRKRLDVDFSHLLGKSHTSGRHLTSQMIQQSVE